MMRGDLPLTSAYSHRNASDHTQLDLASAKKNSQTTSSSAKKSGSKISFFTKIEKQEKQEKPFSVFFFASIFFVPIGSLSKKSFVSNFYVFLLLSFQ